MLPERQQDADRRLRLAVLEALQADARTTSLNLRVGVMNGIVHLAGQAPTGEIWELVELLAAGIPGVRGVVNRIEAPGAPPPGRNINLNLVTKLEEDQSGNPKGSQLRS